MNREEFGLALNALLPNCNPEAASELAEFVSECVVLEEYAYFIPLEQDAAVEKWLDAVFAGLYAVKQEYGPEIAARVAGLCCQRCALYPSEMLPAAAVLKSGGDVKQISAMIDSGDLETDGPFFFDLPDGAALTCQGPEIGIAQSGVPYGLIQKRIEPGFLLENGTALLECERDSFGRYRSGAGMDGMYLQTGKLYAPVRGMDGQIHAFQRVAPVTSQERENAFLAAQNDAAAIYRLKTAPALDGSVPLAQLQKAGESPLSENYDLIHVVPLPPGADMDKTMDSCWAATVMKPGDIAVFKQEGTVTCWYVDLLAKSKLPGLFENYLKAAEIGTEQNYNQIDGIINNEAPKPSVRDNLRQCQKAAEQSQSEAAPTKPSRSPER